MMQNGISEGAAISHLQSKLAALEYAMTVICKRLQNLENTQAPPPNTEPCPSIEGRIGTLKFSNFRKRE